MDTGLRVQRQGIKLPTHLEPAAEVLGDVEFFDGLWRAEVLTEDGTDQGQGHDDTERDLGHGDGVGQEVGNECGPEGESF